MSFNKRLVYYFFGFMIGCFITYFIINQKNTEFNYFPNQRVINDLNKKKWGFDLSFKKIDTLNLLAKSKIIFSKSKINMDTCNTYMIKKTINTKSYFFDAKSCSEIVYFSKLRSSSD